MRKTHSTRNRGLAQSFLLRMLTLIFSLGVFSSLSAQTNTVNITGVVTDKSGEPLIGATVVEVGANNNGTITDLDGNFSLKIDPKNNIEVSYIGYASKVVKATEGKAIKVILLEDDLLLEEVVVTALGIKREAKALGYAMTEIKSEDLNTDAINPVSALQGKAAGVQISGSDGGLFGSSKIQIRGASTLGKNNQPIYVVDGVILDNDIHDAEVDFDSNSNDYGNELKNLNPTDFASVSILRGAAATALYGSRGLNGAIVITTKGGDFKKGFNVSINQSFGFEAVNTLPKYQTDFGQGPVPAATATKRENPWDFRDFEYDNEGRPTILTGGVYWGPRYNGQQVVGYDGEMMNYSPYKNYMKDMYDVGVFSNTNVVVQGGSDKMTFYNSLGYNKAKGVVDNNEFSRLSNMLKTGFKIGDRVSVNSSFTFAISKPKNPQLSLAENTITSSVGPLYNTKYYKHRYKGDNHTGMASTAYGDKYGYVPNKGMWWSMYENVEKREEVSIRPSIDITVDIFDWVSFKAEANMNYYFTNTNRKDMGTGYMNEGVGNGEGGMYRMEQTKKKQQTVASAFVFNKAISDFTVGGFVRGEFYNYTNEFQRNQTDGGLVVPGRFFIANSKKTISSDARYLGKKRILSAIAAANFSWKNQIYLDVTGRNDWSSAMLKEDGTGNYSFFYPSVSGSWIFTESFKESMPNWFSFGKLRASWAQVGNDTDAYTLITGYNIESILQSDGDYIHSQKLPTQLVQNNIKPEKKTSWEVGADLRFFSDRLTFDLAYYKENTKNQIIPIDKPYVSGISHYLVNAGDIQNQGVEVAVGFTPIQTKDWEWNVNMTYTKNKNEIKSLHESSGSYIRLAGYPNAYNFRIASVAKVGGNYGTLMSDAKPAIDKKTGLPIMRYNEGIRGGFYLRSGEVEDLGVSINPDFLGSLGTNLRWKDLSLNILLDCRFGGYIASYSNRYSMAYGLHEKSLQGRDEKTGGITYTSIYDNKQYVDGVIPDAVFSSDSKTTLPGTDQVVELGGLTYKEAIDKGYIDPIHAARYHNMTNGWGNGVVNDNWFHKVKYIAMREISLNYRLPKKFVNKLGANNLTVGFSARNLGYLYNSLPNNLNPEGTRGTAAAEFRERGFTPNRASYTFSIGLDF